MIDDDAPEPCPVCGECLPWHHETDHYDEDLDDEDDDDD